MNSEIRVLIADDHPVFRSGLRMVIETSPEIKLVAEAENGDVALENIRTLKPDVAILDLDMPFKDGFEIARSVEEQKLPVNVVFLTGHKSEALFNKAFDMGIHGYLLKDCAVAEIIDCIRTVAKGQNYISPQLSTYLLGRAKRAAALNEQRPGLQSLTPAERQVLKMVAQEKTSKEIADLLCISVRTVEHHRANICEKLDLRGINALVKFAIANKSDLPS